METLALKALVDKTNNRVIFAECDEDFVDVLFSFFTMPMGKIINRTRNLPPAASVGCMNNLYESVENLEGRRLQTETCRTMLLNPRSATAVQCENLKLILDDDERLKYYCCGKCISSDNKLLSYYRNAVCACGKSMSTRVTFSTKKDFDSEDGGFFVKGLARLIISDELQIVPSSTAASFSLLSKLGITNGNLIEERAFAIDVNKALKLLKCSLVSNTPLTEVLLESNPAPELGEKDIFEHGSSKWPKLEGKSNQNGKIAVKLMISKSKQMVCYAEAGEDFVDLLFSFLCVPLGFIVKQMQGGSSKACITRLYDSVQGLDAEQYLKSPEKKAMLLSPKLAPGFSYENQLLGVEEDMPPKYYYSMKSSWEALLVPESDETVHSDSLRSSLVTFIDPKSHDSQHKDKKSGQGFLKGPALFTVTDELVITPISSISGLSVLSKLKVPFGDIEQRTVHVGKNEALHLLVASLNSKSALTDAFLLKKPKQEVEELPTSEG